MRFINPIEILDLQDTDISKIDNSLIKKAKRVLFADIDLSDNLHFNYKGISLSKSDCETVINELESKDKIEFYHFIASNVNLNNFLVTGNESLFSSFQQESIYKLSDFINFVSPYFSERYDKALLKAYINNDIVLLKKILSVNPPIKHSDIDKLYGSITNMIKKNIGEIDDATRDIKNEESVYDENDIEDIYFWVHETLDTDKINLLPQYFQSTRNQCANSVRNLSVNVFNTFNNAEVAVDLISYALDFDIDGLTKQKLSQDYKQLDEIKGRKDEQARQEPILRKYASFVIEAKSKIEGLRNKTLSVLHVTTWVGLKIDIAEINALDSQFGEIRNQAALILRAISVEVWNSYGDINTSISLISKASSINNLSQTTTQNLLESKNQLNELKRKLELSQKPIQRTTKPAYTSAPTGSASSSDNNGCIWIIVIAAIIGFISIIANSNKSPTVNHTDTNSSTPSSSNYSPTVPDTSTYVSPPLYIEPVITESPYKGNQLRDGASPLDGCFGKGQYAGQAWINFDNSNASDAIICLVDVLTSKTIRNEYIRAGSTFKMSNIPSGTYYLKVYYGSDWNPTLENFCGTKGAFESDTHFSKSDRYIDYINIENTEYSYTTGTITLYAVANGNMSTQPTSESDFFNK